MLAPPFVQALPALDGVPRAYSHELNAGVLYDLCAALVREGLAGPETWQRCQQKAVAFVQCAIAESLGEARLQMLERNLEYHLTISDVLERGGDDQPRSDGRLVLTVECSASGFLKLGTAIEALEQEAVGLGAAFYWTLISALYSTMRIYAHDEAFEYEDRMRDYAEQDDENAERYEMPEVKGAFPQCIRRTLEFDRRQFAAERHSLLRRHRKGRYCSWIERLTRIRWFARRPLWADRALFEDGYYDDPPLPSLLVAFEEQDAIVACFDEERQYMLESTPEPAIGVAFSAREPEEVRHALNIAKRFIALNLALCELMEEIQSWEKEHGRACRDRGDLPVGVA